jgi:hypothetical protein
MVGGELRRAQIPMFFPSASPLELLGKTPVKLVRIALKGHGFTS